MQPSRNDSQRDNIEQRTMENLQEDYNKFVEDGSCASRQKFFYNVLHKKLLDIDLDKVCFTVLSNDFFS